MSLSLELYTKKLDVIKNTFRQKYTSLLSYYNNNINHILRLRMSSRNKRRIINNIKQYFYKQYSILKQNYDNELKIANQEWHQAQQAHAQAQAQQAQAQQTQAQQAQAQQTQAHAQQNPNVEQNKITKSALLIGCNYTGTQNQLNGCLNDVANIKTRIETQYGFNNIVTMTDDTVTKPTRNNIIDGISNLLKNSSEGDVLFLSFSGHGTNVTDTNGDEKDGKDELIVPLDFNCISDDELKSLIQSNLKKNVTMFALFDCCHSGTMLDLKYQYFDDNQSNTIIENSNAYETSGDLIMISGCMDEQTSADAYINSSYQGAMTWSFLNVTDKKQDILFKDLIVNMRNVLKTSQYTQIPMLSSGKMLDLNNKLCI